MDFALLESVVLPSFLEVEEAPDLAFEEDDFELEAEALLLSSFADGEDEDEPDVAPIPEFWFAPNPLLLPPLLLLLLLAVLPEEDDPCVPNELSEAFVASFEF